MKLTICLLVLLPVIYCASISESERQKKWLFDHFDLGHAVDVVKAALASDATSAGCSALCPVALTAASLVWAVPSCSLICAGLHAVG